MVTDRKRKEAPVGEVSDPSQPEKQVKKVQVYNDNSEDAVSQASASASTLTEKGSEEERRARGVISEAEATKPLVPSGDAQVEEKEHKATLDNEEREHKATLDNENRKAATSDGGAKDASAAPAASESKSNEEELHGRSTLSVFNSNSLFGKAFSNPFAGVMDGKSDDLWKSSGQSIISSDTKFRKAGSIFGSGNLDAYTADSSTAKPSSSAPDNAAADNPEQPMEVIPLQAYPGEENEVDVFSDTHAVLFKFVKNPSANMEKEQTADLKESAPEKQPLEKNEEVKNSGGLETKAAAAVTGKYRRQGEGIFRLLCPKELDITAKNVTRHSPLSTNVREKCRLVMRQKGTNSLLLNSPLSVSSTFSTADPLKKNVIRFAALDYNEYLNRTAKEKSSEGENAEGSATSATPIAAYCVKLSSEGEASRLLGILST